MKRISQLLFIIACLTTVLGILFQLYEAVNYSLIGSAIGIGVLGFLWLFYFLFNWLFKPSYLFRGLINLIMIPVLALSGLFGPMIPLGVMFLGTSLIGDYTNQPFDRCEELPQVNDISDAKRRGFDPNRKCCLDTMIGACSIVKDDDRQTLPLEYAASDPKLFEAYLDAGADINLLQDIPTDSPEVIEIALRRSWSTDQVKRALRQASGDSRSVELLLHGNNRYEAGSAETLNGVENEAFLDKLKSFGNSSLYTPIDRWSSELKKLAQYAAERSLPFGPSERSMMLCGIYHGFSEGGSSQTDAINHLLSLGVDPNRLCPYKPLWWVVAEIGDTHIQLLRRLLSAGADLTVCQPNHMLLYREWVDSQRLNPCRDCTKVEMLLKETFEDQLKNKEALFEAQCLSGVDLEELKREAIEKNIPMYVNGTLVPGK